MFAATLFAKQMRVLPCIFVASLLAVCTVAVAQQPPDWDRCLGKSSPTFEQRVSACTAIIEGDGVSPADKARALGNRGVAYANNNNVAAGLRDYEESLRLDDTSGTSHRFRGNKYRIEKNFEGAFAEYNEAVRLDPADVFALTNRGSMYTDRKDYVHALADFEQAMRLDPNWSLAYYGRGRVYHAEKEYDRALADYDQAILLNSTTAYLFTARGSVHQAKGEISQAITDYDQAIQLDSKSVIAYNNRGMAHSAMKDYDSAIADFSEAIGLNPRYANAYANRGYAYSAKGNHSQAIADLDQAIQLDSKSAIAYNNRGMAHNAMKDFDSAIADLSEAIKLNPQYTNAYLNRGVAYSGKGSHLQAITDYDQALQLDSKSVIALNNRGMVHNAMRDYDNAIGDLSEAIRLNPQYANAYVNRGLAYSGKGNHSQAIADYDRAIQINPALAVAYGDRCGDRVAAGQDLHAALSDCNESLRLQPDQGSASTHRGYIYLKLGDVNRAMADFDAALSIDAKNVWPLYGRGLARWKKGDVSGGQADVTAARKARPGITSAAAKYYGFTPQRDLLLRLAVAFGKENSMVFAVAHGSPDSCGAGCNEWIAADGSFDKDVEKRFRSFLDTLHGRKLPIFFTSTGGFMNESFAIGRMLRERKMTAGVGTTIPEDCRGNNVTEDSCRRMLQAGGPLKAQLRTAKAYCNSACVYAFIGASDRQVAAGAVLGVHSPLQTDLAPKSRQALEAIDEQARARRRQYTKEMGVNPELVELADKTPYIDVHVLTRDEIVRLQIETPRH